MNEVCLTVRVVVREGQQEAAAAYLRQLRQAAVQEPGNLAYEVFRSSEHPRTFYLHERYADQTALEAHRATDAFDRYGRNGLFPLIEERRAEYYSPLED